MLLDSETEMLTRQRLFDEVLAAVGLVLAADGAAFWAEEEDHSLTLTASRSMPTEVLEALDGRVTVPLQSIMQRWPESPLVAVPLADQADAIAEEIRAVCDAEGIVGLAGVPCRVAGEMLGLLIVIHREAHAWTVRDLGLATGFAGQLATAMQNARLYSSVRSLANRLTAIHELSLKLAQLRDSSVIVEAIVAEVGRLVDCDTARVYRPDQEGVYRPVAARGKFTGTDDPSHETFSADHGEALPGWVARRNEALIISDVSVERRSIVRASSGPESVLLVPISYGDVVKGVLVVTREGAGRYGPDDEQALAIFARYAGQALLNAENIERLERQQIQLEYQLLGERRLLAVSERLVSTLDPVGVLDEIADTIGSVVRFDRLTVYRLDRSSGRIEPVVSRAHQAEGGASCVDVPMDEGLTSWVIGRGDPVCANDVGEGVLATGPDEGGGLEAGSGDQKQEGRAVSPGRAVQNIIVVPLRVRGEIVGSLNLTRLGGQAARFSEHEFELGKLFAGQASMALQNAEAHLTVASRADLDALTGLRNHGTFQRDLSAMVETGDPFALLMMDLDSFKAFNDTYGHPAGDGLLRAVAQAIIGATRQVDRAYRYGGDEFAILLLDARRSHAEEVAARIGTAVRGAVRHLGGPAAASEVSASVGVAVWPTDGKSKTAVVRVADAALYAAKRLRVDRPQADLDRLPESLSAPLFDAAVDLMGAITREQIAEVTLRHATSIVDTPDAFVALLVRGAGPGGGRAGTTAKMWQLAGSGRFLQRPVEPKRGSGVWGRAWKTGRIINEQPSPAEARLGLPLVLAGEPMGILGLAGPEVYDLGPDRLGLLSNLAKLAAAATGRARGGTQGRAAGRAAD